MLSTFFIILFLLIPRISGSESCQEGLPSQCPFDHESVWWHPLRVNVFNKSADPCHLATYACKHNKTQPGSCTIPNLQAACIACTLFSSSTETPSRLELTTTANTSQQLILSRSANCSASSPTQVPHWVHHHYTHQFDPIKAINISNFKLRAPPSLDPLPDLPQSPTSLPAPLSPMASTLARTPISTTTPNHPPKTSSNAGAIAGGVIGGVLFLSLVTIGVLYFLRRRNQRRVAPSAEFMFLTGSGASYSRALNDSPPPDYSMRNTPDPVLEKAYRSAEAQRRLDSNVTSAAAWEHQV